MTAYELMIKTNHYNFCNKPTGKTPLYNRVIRKLQFLNNFLMKTAFLQGFSPKKCETVREPTGFPNKSNERLNDFLEDML